jgi:hypothetical protein
MAHMALALIIAIFFVAAAPAQAEDRAIYSPIIHVNLEKGWLVVSADGKVFAVEASEPAKPHLSKLPPAGMIDIVVELRGADQPPLLKKWKLASGESSCKVFDGTACK